MLLYDYSLCRFVVRLIFLLFHLVENLPDREIEYILGLGIEGMVALFVRLFLLFL